MPVCTESRANVLRTPARTRESAAPAPWIAAVKSLWIVTPDAPALGVTFAGIGISGSSAWQ
jgi:hypothetical protein